MARAVLVFLGLWVAIALGILHIRQMTGKELWSLTKLMSYSMICAVLAFAVLAGFVILF